MNCPNVAWVLCGDFNEVRDETERKNGVFNERRAKLFNEFIEKMELIEVPLQGKRFTRVSHDCSKLRKLYRFLVSDQFLSMWEDISMMALERNLSDHCPIVMRDKNEDFGPKPLKFFDMWMEFKEMEPLIVEAWNKKVVGQRMDCVFRDKLKNVKEALRKWSKFKFRPIDFEIEMARKETLE
ncbi:uncharacterized protein [Rutidosis leptorrhynchoides]|uniref:uncharacterized protein n=1 Tax=Rutidosis leptorrhynchoides TaxID=125765 RepID=UPI003A99E226